MEGVVNQNFWKGRRVLVTGATGLLGSWLVKELLAMKAHVVILLLEPNPFSELYLSGQIREVGIVKGDLCRYKDVERAVNEHEIEIVFHLGAQAIVGTANRSPLATFETNIRGTYNLLEACRVHKNLVKRILVASSDKAYGEGGRLPYTEDMPLRGQYPYEVSKSCTDLLAQSYFQTYGLPVAIMRCGNIYGGGDLNWNRIIPGTVRSFYQNQAPIIRSDGTFIRDYVFVKNVCQAYLGLAGVLVEKKLAGEAFNYSDGDPLSVLQVVKTIGKLMGCEKIKPKILNQVKQEIHSQHLSSSKLRKIIKLKPVDIETGLTETIRWYCDFFAAKSI